MWKAIKHNQLLTKTRYGGREAKLKTRFLSQNEFWTVEREKPKFFLLFCYVQGIYILIQNSKWKEKHMKFLSGEFNFQRRPHDALICPVVLYGQETTTPTLYNWKLNDLKVVKVLVNQFLVKCTMWKGCIRGDIWLNRGQIMVCKRVRGFIHIVQCR
jgi:hypothetical protein